jgi:hypothetical protein
MNVKIMNLKFKVDREIGWNITCVNILGSCKICCHFLLLDGLFAKCTLFKCHEHIVKLSIRQKYLWIKSANLNKNIYWKVKFNRHTPII